MAKYSVTFRAESTYNQIIDTAWIDAPIENAEEMWDYLESRPDLLEASDLNWVDTDFDVDIDDVEEVEDDASDD